MPETHSPSQGQRVTSQCQLRDVGSLKWPKHVPQITKRAAANWTLARRPLWQGPLLQVRRTRVVTVTARTVLETPSRILNGSSGKAAPLPRLNTLLQSPEPTRQLTGADNPHNKEIQHTAPTSKRRQLRQHKATVQRVRRMLWHGTVDSSR